MKKKNIISSILLSTLIIGFSVKAEEENVEKIFEENVPTKSAGSGRNTFLILGASGAALATGVVGSVLAMKLKNKNLKTIEKTLSDSENDCLDVQNAVDSQFWRAGDLHCRLSFAEAERNELREKLKLLSQKHDDVQAREERALEDSVRVEAQIIELVTKNESLAEQLNKILPIPEMKEAIQNLRVQLDRENKDHREDISPLEEQIASLDRQITSQKEAAVGLHGPLLKNVKIAEKELIENRDLIIFDLGSRKQAYLEDKDFYINCMAKEFAQEHCVPEAIKVFIEELALAELQEFVVIPR